MAVARMRQIDASVTRWYHCMTRCVRRAFLLEEGTVDRKAWIEDRLTELAQVFAVAVGGFAVMNVPETSPHTSIKTRVEHVETQGRTAQLEAANCGSVAGSCAASGLEESLWLCPIEDRHELDSSREGMLAGFSLGSYLLLVDDTGRLFRTGKAAMSTELAGVFARLGIGAETWQMRLKKLRAGRLFGRFFAATRDRLKAAAGHLGVGIVRNLSGCPVA